MATRNNTFYSYKTLLSYMNCFDPNDTTKYASFQSNSNVKLIITIPGVSACGLDETPNYAYFKTPSAAMMQSFTSQMSKLASLGAPIPDTLKNFSPENNIINLDDSTLCPETSESEPIESGMDIVASAMIASGCNVEFWVSKYSLLGVLVQIQERAKAKTNKDEKWIFSLSWGTYGICDILSRDKLHQIGIGQTCDSINLGCPSSDSTPCQLSNGEYIQACEALLKDLTENYNCIFFVSSGDTGPVSNDNFTSLPYYVDYPTSSQYTISAGGVNYTDQAPSDQSTTNPDAYNLVNNILSSGLSTVQTKIQQTEDAYFKSLSLKNKILYPVKRVFNSISNGIDSLFNKSYDYVSNSSDSTSNTTTTGIALPMTMSDRNNSTPNMLIGGQSDATVGSNNQSIMATGGGFTGYNSNDTLFIKARSSQIPFVNNYYNNIGMPSDFSNSLSWNSSAPQRGTPDIAACMSNGLGITWGDSNSAYVLENADGTSFSSPLLAGFFALLLSYQDVPSGTQLIDFIYANPDCFDKPQTAAANTWTFDDEQGNAKTINGFMSTTAQGTWDPCVGLGVPNFIKLYNTLKSS